MKIETIDNNLKGAMAEQLTKELFFDAKFEVYFYGVEHLVPGFTSRTELKNRDKKHHTNKVIRNLPDFLVIKDDRSYYVEAKFRSNGLFKVDNDYPFPDAFIMLFSRDEIQMGLARDLMSGDSVFLPLAEFNPLGLNLDTVIQCKEVLSKYFTHQLQST